MKAGPKTYKIFIVAGEASGDVLGGKLLKSLKKIYSNIDVFAVGGPVIESAGAKLLFNCTDIALMGFSEILPKLPKVLLRLKQTVDAIEAFDPDILITIDSPGFNFRLVTRLRKRLGKRFPIIHYVAPTVWAYKKERADLVAELYDHILLLLPFEKPYFDKVGIESTYVGHPIIEDKLPKSIKAIKLETNTVPIVIMPGSRAQEIHYMGGLFAKALKLLETRYNLKLKVLIPTLDSLESKVKKIFANLNAEVSIYETDKQTFFKTAKLALVKSGTSSLEMAKHNIPCVVGYKMFSLTYRYLKRIVYAKFISLINIILDKPVIPELIQEDCTTERIAAELYELLNTKVAKTIKSDYAKALKMLENDKGVAPSELAAKTVLGLLHRKD
jgi:lipid-A-disaccharide synthase